MHPHKPNLNPSEWLSADSRAWIPTASARARRHEGRLADLRHHHGHVDAGGEGVDRDLLAFHAVGADLGPNLPHLWGPPNARESATCWRREQQNKPRPQRGWIRVFAHLGLVDDAHGQAAVVAAAGVDHTADFVAVEDLRFRSGRSLRSKQALITENRQTSKHADEHANTQANTQTSKQTSKHTYKRTNTMGCEGREGRPRTSS